MNTANKIEFNNYEKNDYYERQGALIFGNMKNFEKARGGR